MNKLMVMLTGLIMLSGMVASDPPNPGAIWTTRGDCGAEQQDVNHYVIGEKVFVNGENFNEGTYEWTVKGQPGGASCDPNAVVASGTMTFDTNDAAFCFDAYTVANDDCGEYTVDVGVKNDNYRVCNDNDACTIDSVGSNGNHCAYVPVVCDNGDPCTDPVFGCYNNPGPTTTTIPTAPEFSSKSGGAAVLVLLMVAPVFAYMVARKRV